MAREDNYFQFPIAALRLGKPIDEVTTEEASQRQQLIVQYCISEMISCDFKPAEYARNRDELQRIAPFAIEDIHVRVYLAMKKLKVEHVASLRSKKEFEEQISKNFDGWHAISNLQNDGGTQMARMRIDLFWDLNKSFTWREWSVLASIYAAIGKRKYFTVTIDRIRAMSLGFNSTKDLHKFSGGYADLQIAYHQAKYTISKLEDRNLFVKASPKGRSYVYSKSLTLPSLIEILATKESQEQAKMSHSERTALIRSKGRPPATRSCASSIHSGTKDHSKSNPLPLARIYLGPETEVEAKLRQPESTEEAKTRFLKELHAADLAPPVASA